MTGLNLRGVTSATWIRTAVLLVAIINQILSNAGYAVLPFSDEEVESMVTTLITAVTAVVCWWKNNSFTFNAQDADMVCGITKSTIIEEE